jgi:1,4-alpha-glucan branching enzyme
MMIKCVLQKGSIAMKKSNYVKGKKVTFSFQTEKGKDVFIAGTFNNWQPGKTKLKYNGAGKYTTAIRLSAGRHEYKFIVNDEWCVDPQNPETIPNHCGSMNNVIIVE